MSHHLILPTGMTGFVAKHRAVELLRHGYTVRGTLRTVAEAEQVRATLGSDLIADA